MAFCHAFDIRNLTAPALEDGDGNTDNHDDDAHPEQ